MTRNAIERACAAPLRWLCAGLLALWAAHALAWGEAGHFLAGAIADRHLTPAAAREVEFLLRSDRLASGERSGRRTLAEVAYWADEIKDYGWGRSRSRWHYEDIPVCGGLSSEASCRKGNCVTAQLERQLGVLANPRAPVRTRNEALKWVVHLVGDLHQPLHAADNADHGGNRVEVSFYGERDNPPWGSMNLHALWDVHLLARLLDIAGGRTQFLASPIGASEKARAQDGTVQDWMQESNRIARLQAYGRLPGGYACNRPPSAVLPLGEQYFARAAPVIQAQLHRAGIRLAWLLNAALGR